MFLFSQGINFFLFISWREAAWSRKPAGISIPYEYIVYVAKGSCTAQLKSSPRTSPYTTDYVVVTCQLLSDFSPIIYPPPAPHPPQNAHPFAESPACHPVWSLDGQAR